MGSVVVAIPDIPGLQMEFFCDDYVVEQIAAAASYEALGDSICQGLRTAVRSGVFLTFSHLASNASELYRH
jgi:hypothetical protein